jgi:hypothetical protein
MTASSSPIDPLAQLRGILSGSMSSPDPLISAWRLRKTVGTHPRFKGSQEIRISVAGEETFTHVLIETFDKKDRGFALTRYLDLAHAQIPAFLEFLLKAEEVEATLFSTNRMSWPLLPLYIGEALAASNTVKISIDEFRERLQIKVSKEVLSSSPRRSGEWSTFGGQDVRPIALLIIQAFDSLGSGIATTVPQEDDEAIPF